jgi:hypothetical protein
MCSKWTDRRCVASALILATLLTAGCMPPGTVGMTAATAQQQPQSYMPVDFKKWHSGMYADEFFGKAVVIEGYFGKNPIASMYQGSDITFFVREKSISQLQQAAQRAAMRGAPMSPLDTQLMPISITAPLAMRDVIYPIQDEQRVRVYGVVVNPYMQSALTRQVTMSTLQVRAERVEVVR